MWIEKRMKKSKKRLIIRLDCSVRSRYYRVLASTQGLNGEKREMEKNEV